jgi:predicted metal-dependent phosphoesterase TrpH
MTVADLHTHTTVTDGRVTPWELVDLAVAAELEYLVITDHSTVTYDAVLGHASSRGVQLPFPGTEISTFLGDRKYHVLIYGPGLSDCALQERLRFPIDRKLEDAQRLLDLLAADGHRLPSLNEIVAAGTEPGRPTPEKRYPSRTAIARQLVRVSGITELEARHIVSMADDEVMRASATPRERLRQRYLPTLEIIEAAASRGLVTSLAHPVWECRDADDIAEVCGDVRRMAETGLAGMESRSYHHRALDDHPQVIRTRAELGLLATGGSDFHGNGRTELGVGGVGREAFDALLAAVESGHRRSRPEGFVTDNRAEDFADASHP